MVLHGHGDRLKVIMEVFPHDIHCLGTGKRDYGCLKVVTKHLMLQRIDFHHLRWTVTCPQHNCGFFSPLSSQKSLKMRTCWNVHSDGDFKYTKRQKCLNPAYWLSLHNNEKHWLNSFTLDSSYSLWLTVITQAKMKLNLVKNNILFQLFPQPKRKSQSISIQPMYFEKLLII